MYEFCIYGKPVSQPRPRFVRRGKKLMSYDPKTAQTSKAHIQNTVLLGLEEDFKPLDGPIFLEIEAWFPCPKSKWRKRNPIPETHKSNGPDIDNVAKHYMDALFASGMLSNDDRQIAKLHITKYQCAQGDNPKTIVRFGLLEEEVAQ